MLFSLFPTKHGVSSYLKCACFRFFLVTGMLFLLFASTVPAQEADRRQDVLKTPVFTPPTFFQSLKDRYWGEMYFQTDYTHYDDDNVIADGSIKQGIHCFNLAGNYVDTYLKGRFLYDRDGDFWNNAVEGAIGMRWRPLTNYGLILFTEGIYGTYTGRESEDKNTDSKPYFDFQGGYAFWQWWGTQSWQIEGIKTYLPFTGWRVAYSDGIYHQRDDNNFIATLDYREGLLLGRIGGVSFDGFLSVEAGFDTNGDSWNNYFRSGPGVSVAPIPGLDMNISFEYHLGRFYRGDVEDGSDRSFDNFLVILSFWHAW